MCLCLTTDSKIPQVFFTFIFILLPSTAFQLCNYGHSAYHTSPFSILGLKSKVQTQIMPAGITAVSRHEMCSYTAKGVGRAENNIQVKQ